MIDWTWISKDICLIIYYDYVNKKVIRFWFYEWERYEYIENDLKVLRDEFKYEITCFIVDWAKSIKKAIEKVFPNSKIQRCLTHIKNAIPYMFYYLKDENINRSNNNLEWYNWVLDGHIFSHRWLRKDRLISFISLWIYNRNL